MNSTVHEYNTTEAQVKRSVYRRTQITKEIETFDSWRFLSGLQIYKYVIAVVSFKSTAIKPQDKHLEYKCAQSATMPIYINLPYHHVSLT